MKNKLIYLIAAALLLQTSVMATVNEPTLNLENETLTVTGNTESQKAGRYVNVLVFNPDKSISDLGTAGALQYNSSTITDENGDFTFHIAINKETMLKDETGQIKAGEFTIIVKDDEAGQPETFKKFFADRTLRESIVKLMVSNAASDSKTNEEKIEELTVELNEYKKELSLENNVFNNVGKDTIASLIINNGMLKSATIATIQKIIFENVLLAAFNEGKSSLLYVNDSLMYQAELGLTAFDTDKDCTIKKLFDSYITQTGRQKTVEDMCKNNFGILQDLKNKFAVQTVLKAIAYPNIDGYGVLKDILTSKNAKAVGLNLTTYMSLSDTNKGEVNRDLYKNEYQTLQALQNAIDSSCENHKDQVTPPSSPYSGGKGSGRVSDGSATYISVVDAKKTESFSDIDGCKWANQAIIALYEKGVIIGPEKSKFAPDEKVTREQLAKIVCLAFGYDITNNNHSVFSDVQDEQWYTSYVQTLYSKGIISGISDSEFGVGMYVTRQDIATIIYRIIGNNNISEEKEFTDKKEISAYAKDAVNYLAGLKILNGFEDGRFGATEHCTRAQAAKIVYDSMNAR